MKCIIDKMAFFEFEQLHKAEMPIYFQSSWMNALYGEEWNAMVIVNLDEVVGVFCFPTRKKWGFNIILHGPFTQYSGLFVPEKHIHFYKKIANVLIDKLNAFYYQNFSLLPKYNDLLTWKWKGYSSSFRFTYLIPKNEYGSIYNQYSNNIKSDLRYASKNLKIVKFSDSIITMPFLNKIFTGYNLQKNEQKRIISAIMKLENSICLYSMDDKNKIHSLLINISDSHTVYNIVNTRNEESLRGSMTLLIDHAIKIAADDGKSYDFEGSSIESIASFFEHFGGTLSPYLQLYKTKFALTNAIVKTYKLY